MITALLLTLLLTFENHTVQAQNPCKDCIAWSISRPLVWDDFRGRPNASSHNKAVTDSGMSITFSCENGKVDVGLDVYFNPNRSWTKVTDSEHLLAHEQLHFDITELFVRKLRKQLTSLGTNCAQVNKYIQEYYDRNYESLLQYQQKYDKETRHSIDAEEQRRWETKVAAEMKALAEFSSKPEIDK